MLKVDLQQAVDTIKAKYTDVRKPEQATMPDQQAKPEQPANETDASALTAIASPASSDDCGVGSGWEFEIAGGSASESSRGLAVSGGVI
jgi:hypothetical protein